MRYNQLTTESFISKANKIHNGKFTYPLAEYINNHTKIKITCPVDNHGVFEQTPAAHLAGQGCPKCKFKKLAKDRKKSDQEIITKFRNIHGDKFDYSLMKYTNLDTPIDIICPIHGKFKQRPFDHLRNNGCSKCGYKILSNLRKSDKEQFIYKAHLLHNNIYNYSEFEYVNSQTKGTIICHKHGKFKQTPNNHLKGKGCPICKASKGEKLIAFILDKYNIKHIAQYRIPGNNFRFRYDFYLPELNILIEFHGIQHYKVKEFFGGLEALKETQFRDACKRSLAYEYRIKLLEFNYKQLKYLDKKEFETLVIKTLQLFN